MSVLDSEDASFKQDDLMIWLETTLKQAIKFHQDGQIDEAKEIYHHILQKIPTQPNANHNLGLIALDSHQVDESLALFKAALESAPEESQYWISYIQALMKAAQYDEAHLVMSYGVNSGLQGSELDALKLKLDGLTFVSSVNKSVSYKKKLKKSEGLPTSAEINALALAFNQADFEKSKSLAIELTQDYPTHGVAWKVLGAIYEQLDYQDLAFNALKNAAKFLPKDDEAQYNLGNYFYDQGMLDDAAKSYKKAIKLNSAFLKAHYNLGNVYKKQENLKQASASYIKALALDKQNLSIIVNLAQALYEQNKILEARTYYEKALEQQPHFVPAIVGMGAVYKSLSKFKEAEDYFRKALKIKEDVEVYTNLGDLLKETDRLDEAEFCFKEAIQVNPKSADAYAKLGVFLRSIGRVKDSISYFNQALEIDCLRKASHIDLGLAKAELGEYVEAELCYRKALEIDKDNWSAYNNLGLPLYNMSRFEESEAAFKKSIELNPNQALVHSNLSLPVTALGRIKEAENCLKKAIELSPEYVNAYINLCTNYLAQGNAHDAELACLEALRQEPSSTTARSNLLFTMNYSGEHSASYRLEQARQFDAVVLDAVKEPFTHWMCNFNASRLRIGLVSADFRQHPVAYFLENWAKQVDFSKMELFAYSTVVREDEMTGRLKPNFSSWKSLLGLTNKSAAKLIHEDAPHILIDLSGHTSGNRLPIFAFKPAPLQVSWIGYFATTGMKSIDYFIADLVGVPEINKTQFIEKIKYVPDTRLCFTAPNHEIDVSTLPALKNNVVTFASFQTRVKASDEVLSLWAEVLRAVPHSQFRWQCKSFGDQSVASDLIEKFAQLGIASSRIKLLGSVSREAYLAAHAEVDLILDTFPYPGGTTTCEGLWMGVPTLTLAGNTLIARQGASLMSAAGLSDWVVETRAEYVNKAICVSKNLNTLAALRLVLRDQVLTSPLFNAQLFAKNIQNILYEMWADYQKNSAEEVSEINFHDLTELDSQSILIVSTTMLSENDFWNKSALGLSLPRHLKQDKRLSVKVAYENLQNVAEIFNQAIDGVSDDVTLVFIHDDVWIDEACFCDALLEGLSAFDVIGVAGNKRRLPYQPSWRFVDSKFTRDDSVNLSGQMAHGKYAFGKIEEFGSLKVECELLDGVFYAVKKSTLLEKAIRFDPQFDFYFYDLDFFCSARLSGLLLGTWPIKLTHQESDDTKALIWNANYQRYLSKWNAISSSKGNLKDAVFEVLQIAETHKKTGELNEAVFLYQEILIIEPDHPQANHDLGVIEAQLQGAMVALPRLEKAVQAKPEVEQYWVSYIDAMMELEALDTVVEALEFGQQFGLRKEVAQLLAADFVKKLDAKAERKLELQNQAIEALQFELKPKKLSAVKSINKYANPVFYVWAPPYTDKSSGIKALHLLCDRLNSLGYEAYITSTVVNEKLNTPIATNHLIHQHKQEARLQIAIYPEVQMGNPLLARNVVRYLLNKPNYFVKTSWFGQFHKDERMIHYGDVISIPWVQSEAIRIQTINRDLFNLPDDSSKERKGFLVYSHRAKPDLENIPEWCKPFELISMSNPKTPEQLAELYKKSAGLIVYERTMAVLEAMLCGCPIITCSAYGLDKSTNWYDGYDDYLITWDFDRDAYLKVCDLMDQPSKIYDSNIQQDLKVLKDVFKNIVTHFREDQTDEVENTPLFGIEQAKIAMQKSDIKSAILSYRHSLVDHPENVETYYRLGENLINIELYKEAILFLQKGEFYLSQLPKSELLNSIRFNYYKKLSMASSKTENVELADYYDAQAYLYDTPVTTG